MMDKESQRRERFDDATLLILNVGREGAGSQECGQEVGKDKEWILPLSLQEDHNLSKTWSLDQQDPFWTSDL